jgi:hypothetical protein
MSVVSAEKKLHDHTSNRSNARSLVLKSSSRSKMHYATLWPGTSRGATCRQGCVAPEPPDLKGLFEIDMDDPIWFDLGLGEITTRLPFCAGLAITMCTTALSPFSSWTDCDEELKRLRRERSNIQTWFAAQWGASTQAYRHAEGTLAFAICCWPMLISNGVHNPSLAFPLEQRLSELREVCW